MVNQNEDPLWSKVDRALDEIRPHLAVDGGNVELVEITKEKVVLVKWVGSCENCTMSAMTMQAGVQEVVKNKIPEILKVVAVNGVGSVQP
jgi:Fe-S cluster biogenesis protein NfuA